MPWSITLAVMPPSRTTVFLPCHTLDDFPTWLEDAEADALLAAWTAAWHPAVIAAIGGPPGWASVDQPIGEEPLLGIVPAPWDDRFAAQFDSAREADCLFVRRTSGSAAISRAAVARLASVEGLVEDPLPGAGRVADFQALGLAVLLAELLARRMRSSVDLGSTGFAAAAVAAARSAVEGREAETDAALRECFDSLSATRARYYPVDSWIVELAILAPTTSAAAVAAIATSPVPVSVVATGATIESLAASRPEALQSLREACLAGRIGLCGGRNTDQPLDACTPEAIADSFRRGREAWRVHLGREPVAFARVAGGSSALLPQVLAGFGYEAGIWSLFDGSFVPDVGGGLVRFEGGGSRVDFIAAHPLDGRSVRTVLALAETIGDAMDREHVAILVIAHAAGTASRWIELLRRIGRWTGLLGTFVTPEELVRRAPGAGTPAALEPDAFPPTLPRGTTPGDDVVGAAITAAREEAGRLVAAALPFTTTAPAIPGRAAAESPTRGAAPRPSLVGRLFGGGRREADRLVLANGLLRVEAHPATGGLLSIRRPTDRGNRLSQQLAVRTTRPAAEVGAAWESAEERAVFTRMVADEVARERAGAGHETLVSRGRLVDPDGGVAARYVQRVSLAAELPLAVVDVDVDLEQPLEGPLLEQHVAARFAWHENEDVEIARSLHTQSIVTERSRFTAAHFIEIASAGSRSAPVGDAITILTGGMPWHLLSSPHVLDAVLAGAGAGGFTRRFAVGIGVERPWDAALSLLAAAPFAALGPALPVNVRLTVDHAAVADGRLRSARVGLLESAGRAGEVRVDWGREVTRAAAVDLAGRSRPDVVVAVDGSCTVVSLARYQWLHLDLGFAE